VKGLFAYSVFQLSFDCQMLDAATKMPFCFMDNLCAGFRVQSRLSSAGLQNNQSYQKIESVEGEN